MWTPMVTMVVAEEMWMDTLAGRVGDHLVGETSTHAPVKHPAAEAVNQPISSRRLLDPSTLLSLRRATIVYPHRRPVVTTH